MRAPRPASLAAALLLGTASTAAAVPIAVPVTGATADEIVGVEVGSTTYDVTFVANAVDHTFDKNTAAEAGAASQIEAALNATGAKFVGLAGVGAINQFIVGNILTGGQQVTSFSIAHRWQSNGFASGDGSASVFTPVAAPTVVLGTRQVVQAVDGLVVDGKVYDVTFKVNAVEHTFDGNPIAEDVAAAELENALNATTAPFVALAGVGAINQFVVGDILTGGIQLTSFSEAGQWQNNGIVTNDGSAAVFTPVPVPEPVTILAFATGLAGLALVVRRPRRASA